MPRNLQQRSPKIMQKQCIKGPSRRGAESGSRPGPAQATNWAPAGSHCWQVQRQLYRAIRGPIVKHFIWVKTSKSGASWTMNLSQRRKLSLSEKQSQIRCRMDKSGMKSESPTQILQLEWEVVHINRWPQKAQKTEEERGKKREGEEGEFGASHLQFASQIRAVLQHFIVDSVSFSNVFNPSGFQL